MRTRNATGDVHDYGDPRLLHERGLIASLEAAWLDTPAAVAGVDHERAAELCVGNPPPLPTTGASSSLFALAGHGRRRHHRPAGRRRAGDPVRDHGVAAARRRSTAANPPHGRCRRADSPPARRYPISLAAYERAFEAKVRWEAGQFADSDELDFPPRYRVGADGALATDYELVPLPRTGTVYTETTVHIPVPGLRTPYSLVIVELDGVGVRALVKVTGAEPGTVDIGDRGRLALASGRGPIRVSPTTAMRSSRRPAGMRNVAIVGAGMTPFGEHFALGIKDLLPMAFADCAASVDKGLSKSDLQAAWFGAMGTTDGFPSGILADSLGLPDLPVTRVENSCATGNDAVRNALFGVASGAFDVALVMGADKLRDTTSRDMLWEWEAMTRDMAWDYPLGVVSPAGFALHVRRYLHESPATEEHLAMVAVKNHRHGVNNPKARLRFEITMEQALTAPTVVTPFRLYDCAPQSDGAAALVIAAEDVVDRFTDRPVWIRGVGIGLDSVMHQHKPDLTTLTATVRAAKQAFKMAGMTPSDVDVAEVHDFFTGIELISYEDLGFAERFGAYKLVEAEVTSVGGSLAGESQRRAEGQGPSTRRDRCGTVRRTVRTAARRGRQSGRRRANWPWRTTSVARQPFQRSRSWKEPPMARGSGPERWSPGMPPIRKLAGPMQAVGGSVLDVGRCGAVRVSRGRFSGGSSSSSAGSSPGWRWRRRCWWRSRSRC